MIEQVIEAARVCWSLGDAPVSLVAARENRVYRVDGPDGPSVLRLHRQGYRSTEEIHSELQWMEMLAANSMSVPKPVPSQDGTFVKTIHGIVVDMLSWVDGIPLAKTHVTADNHYELGCLLAKMHNLNDQWELPSGFSRPTWDLVGDQPLWGRFWDNPHLTQEQRKRFLQFRDTARGAIDTMDQPDFGLIHADLVPDNVLIDGNQLQLIDFDAVAMVIACLMSPRLLIAVDVRVLAMYWLMQQLKATAQYVVCSVTRCHCLRQCEPAHISAGIFPE